MLLSAISAGPLTVSLNIQKVHRLINIFIRLINIFISTAAQTEEQLVLWKNFKNTNENLTNRAMNKKRTSLQNHIVWYIACLEEKKSYKNSVITILCFIPLTTKLNKISVQYNKYYTIIRILFFLIRVADWSNECERLGMVEQ